MLDFEKISNLKEFFNEMMDKVVILYLHDKAWDGIHGRVVKVGDDFVIVKTTENNRVLIPYSSISAIPVE